MTKRSIYAGLDPTIIIKSVSSVTVTGWDSDRVLAETAGRRWLKVETRDEAELARARAAVGEHVLFDLHLKLPRGKEKEAPEEAIEVQMGGEGRVFVPQGSRVKVYAGRNAAVSGLQGSLSVCASGDAQVRAVRSLVYGSCGGAFDLECETIAGQEIKLEAGRDLRCYIRDLTSARLLVKDLGGYWEGMIGAGSVTVRLQAGGDAILVTDQQVEPVPPNYILGQIERPGAAHGAG
jgi:hypothetical protein